MGEQAKSKVEINHSRNNAISSLTLYLINNNSTILAAPQTLTLLFAFSCTERFNEDETLIQQAELQCSVWEIMYHFTKTLRDTVSAKI